MGNKDIVKMLSEVPLFSDLSKKELDQLSRAVKTVHHREGSVLAREGESGLGFFLIVDGTVGVKVGARSRTKMGPGDFFGEISLIDGGPRSATLVAETPVTTIGLTQWVFKRMVESSPGIAFKMLKVMAGRLRAAGRDPTA